MSVMIAIGLGAVVILAALVAVAVVIPKYAEKQLPEGRSSPFERLAATTELRRVVVEATAALLLVVGAVIGFSEYRATKERQDSERFAQVIEMLGSSDVPTQIGAVYGLEGVARSDPSYYPIIDDTLSALVRARAPYGDATRTTRPVTTPPATPSVTPSDALPATSPEAVPDPVVQAAVRVLGRVPYREDRRIDLTRSNLYRISLLGGDFRQASFDESNLFEVDATGADLRGASFRGAVAGGELCTARLGSNPGLPDKC